MVPPYRVVSLLAVLALTACSGASGEDAADDTSDLTGAVTPASFACTAPNSVDLAVVTHGTKSVTVSANGVSATGHLNSHNTVSLGAFLSEDNGSFTIKLGASMLRGSAGNATLSEIEEGDPAVATSYACRVTH
jgi:hypothetical protein